MKENKLPTLNADFDQCMVCLGVVDIFIKILSSLAILWCSSTHICAPSVSALDSDACCDEVYCSEGV